MAKTKTRQQLFSAAYRGLAKQGFKRSQIKDSTGVFCAYRGDEGRRCAIGWGIPNAAYDTNLEGNSTYTKVIQRAAGIDAESAWFARCLQSCHDGNRTARAMKSALKAFAKEHNLQIPGVSR